MLTRDAAESSLASCPAADPAVGDSLLDVFREIISTQFPAGVGFQERTEKQYELLMKELKEQGIEPDPEPARAVSAAERQVIVHETLMIVYGDTRHEPDVRLIAAAVLATMNRVEGSYQAIADQFGATRACPHLHSRRFETRTGIRPRRAKNDEARDTSKRNAQGRRRGDAPKVHRGSNVFGNFPGLS